LKQEITATALGVWRSGVGRNAVSLYMLQFANYLLPLATVPYLVRVLGPAHYGLVAFGQGLIAYFAVLVDYGFALSATRKISVIRSDTRAVSETACNVWAAKGLICLATFGALLALVSASTTLSEIAPLLVILFGTVIGGALFPVWLFQGMEQMIFISAINLGTRLLVVVAVFTMVRQPEHYLLYAGLMSSGHLVAGFIGVCLAFRRFRLHLVLPSRAAIWEALVEGWTLFLSTAAISLHTAGNAFILGMMTNPTVVGYYAAAERIVRAVDGLTGPIHVAAFPRFSRLAGASRSRTLLWGRRMLLLMIGLGGASALALIAGAPVIVRVILGSAYDASIAVTRVLAVLPLFIAVNKVLGIQVMLPFGRDKAFMTILMFAGLMNALLAIALAPVLRAVGVAVAVVVSELMITVSMFAYLSHCGISPASRRATENQTLKTSMGEK